MIIQKIRCSKVVLQIGTEECGGEMKKSARMSDLLVPGTIILVKMKFP